MNGFGMMRLSHAAGLLLIGCILGCSPSGPEVETVVVYTSQDAVYARPILDEFERRTGIEVRAVFDSEAVKSTALAQRLAAERGKPRCDVFWSNEELRTRQLVLQGILEKPVKTTVYRSRHIVINTNMVPVDTAPRSIADLTAPEWSGRIALAFPFYGTTANHFQALRIMLGEEAWTELCSGLHDNDPLVVDGNSQVVRAVGTGQRAAGLTDTDDVRVGIRNGYPLHSYPDARYPVRIHNSMARVSGAPNPENADRLIDYLQSAEVSMTLVDAGAADALPDSESLNNSQFNENEWERIIGALQDNQETLRQFFLR